MGEPGTKEILSLDQLEAVTGLRTGRKHILSILVENKPGVLTRIAGLFARAFRCGERDERAGKRQQFVGLADRGVAEIPTGVGGKRHRDVRQADAGDLVTVFVDLRLQQRQRVRGRVRKVGAIAGQDRARRVDAG